MELVGRDDELADLLDRLSSHRLVTVIGPGGVGKTALATAAVDQTGDAYPRGSHVVDLTVVDDADAVGSAMAAQLGFPSFAALLGSPTEQPALLLIDNCEHLIDAAASAIAQLLDACRSPTVVATSRSPLDLPGESVLVVGPLPVPPPGRVDAHASAVRLFYARARDAGVSIGDEHLAVVSDLCRALDGLPLAIELAAARSRSMTPAEMLSRLDLDTLARPQFRGSQRHRSLRDTIEWSYRLLSEPDQRMFCRLGVLAGPFTFDTAHAVGADPSGEPADSMERIDSLVGTSLLVAEPSGQVTRYRQLDTLRTYAQEGLHASGEWESTWERYVEHILEAAHAVSAAGGRRWDAGGLARPQALYDDLLAALRWCVEHDAQPSRAFRLQAMLWELLHQGHLEDAAALSERTLARWPEPTTPGWADAAATVVTCRYLLGDPRQAISLAEQALAHVEGSTLAPCVLHRVIGQAQIGLEDPAGALVHFAKAASEAQDRGVDGFALEMSLFRAATLADMGELDEALRILRSVQPESAKSDIDVWTQTVLGQVLVRVDVGRATPVVTAALDLARRMDNPACVRANLHSLALTNIANGDLAGAAGLALEVLDDVAARGAVATFRPVLRTAAVILQRVGRPAWADITATTEAMPRVGNLGFPGRELFALPEAPGQALAPGAAMTLAGRELRPVAGGDEVPLRASTGEDGPAEEGAFLSMGEFWEVGFGGRTVTLKSSKGMDDLARLLVVPGRDIHCTELAGAVVEQPSTGEVIDQTARRQYEQRIRDLRAEIDDAETDNDIARTERAQREFDALVEHLSVALGFGGRARRTGGTTERARSAVTQRIRSTIQRIAAAHPDLGRHLQASIATGTYCGYRPERPIHWRT